MIINGKIEIIHTYIHCVLFKGTSSNIFARYGIITTTICSKVPTKKLPTKYLFSNIPVLKIDSSLYILKL